MWKKSEKYLKYFAIKIYAYCQIISKIKTFIITTFKNTQFNNPFLLGLLPQFKIHFALCFQL